ncbi:MAG: hypothetical protein KJ634_04515 [Gammaproteobacteria bacterium]|nr:hypothetical protein [Gammaproteobacteria bacterium]MBU1414867.1 hypothetical protein [Gammaproteobacteria bacterium]
MIRDIPFPAFFARERLRSPIHATMFALSRFLPRRLIEGPGRLYLSPTLIRGAAWFGAALVVGWVIATWFWQIAAPEPAPGVEADGLPDHQTAAKAIVAHHLFGGASLAGDDSEAIGGAVNFRLLGAMTGSPEATGFAILAEDGKSSVAAVEGETFLPGVTLLEVLPGQVRLKIGERVETINMAETTTSPDDMAPAARPASSGQAVRPQLGSPPRPEGPRR